MQPLDITPNAAKTIESLRHLTYTNTTALADIVDNSLDAKANIVNIGIDTEKQEVTIMDDGYGMSLDVMHEAIKLGSDTTKEQNELGRFGMGLVTAGISIARRIEVYSKQEGEELKMVCLDLDKIAETNKWVAEECEPSADLKKAFGVRRSGTIIRLTKADNLAHGVVGNTKNELSRVFRKFLKSGIKMYVNGAKLEAIDPLELWRTGKTVVLLNEDIDVNGEKLHITMSWLDPNCSGAEANNRKYSIGKQGFYVVRNGREIASASTLGIFTRHQSYNHMRTELSYSSKLDDAFGINFTKNSVNISQALSDKIRAICAPYMKMIADNKRKKEAVENSKKIDHSESESVINRCANLLRKNSPVEHRHHDEDPTKQEKKKPESTKERKNFKEFKLRNRGMKFRIIEADLGRDSLYDYEIDGDTVVIKWNINHPFHREMIAKNAGDNSIVTPLDSLICSMVIAEIHASNDETATMLDRIRSDISCNLKTILPDL